MCGAAILVIVMIPTNRLSALSLIKYFRFVVKTYRVTGFLSAIDLFVIATRLPTAMNDCSLLKHLPGLGRKHPSTGMKADSGQSGRYASNINAWSRPEADFQIAMT